MGILNVQGVVAPRDGHCLHLFTVIHISVRVYGVEGDHLGALHPHKYAACVFPIDEALPPRCEKGILLK